MSASPVYQQASMLLDDPATRAALVSLDQNSVDSHNRKCKIICTMGPCCWDVDMLVKLIDCGMNICRLNFSHGDHEAHGKTVQRIREAARQRPDKPVAILLDTKGPEIRTGFFRDDAKGPDGKIHLVEGEELRLKPDPALEFKGDKTELAVTY